jgi:predicted MFS family arabinose efflux permease
MSTITATTVEPPTAAASGLVRRLLPLHAAVLLQNVGLWVPVEKLFLDEIGFDPASVGLMAAAYAGVVPLLEIPSGILADRWSRRGVLALASLALLVSVTIGGLSHSVTMYIVGALFLGVFFALQSGTVDAVVYDTVLEETGSGDAFERRIGRVRMLESAGLVSSALAGGWLAAVTSPRLTYFLTLPFLAASAVALLAFREPRLNRTEERTSLRTHVATTYRAITQRGCLLPLIGVMVLTSLLANMMFEFGPLWLVALGAPAVLYGPHFAGLTSSFGLAGLLAGRLRLGDPLVMAAVVAVMVGSSLVLTAVHDPVVVTVAQVVLTVLAVLLGILLTARLHDAVPSAIRAGVASGVGTFTWIAFLPFGLLFGYVSKHVGVYPAGWMIVGATAVAGALLIRLSLTVQDTSGTESESGSHADEPLTCLRTVEAAQAA